jgi:hypothetical protein
MALTREQRVMLHKKQERIRVASGAPIVGDLTEGVPVLRLTEEGLVQYVRHSGVLYKSVYSKA